jgi:hypothetical protein
MKCVFGGPARNCEPFIEKVLENIEILAKNFDDYLIIIVYDESSDNTLNLLKEYQKINPKLTFYVNTQLVPPYRTHRIAYARNRCLQYVNTLPLDEYPLFIMMDMDYVNAKNVNSNVLKKFISTDNWEKWDSLSFNTFPKYYDIWGLSIYPYCFSYNHFKNSDIHNYYSIQNYIQNKLENNGNKLLQCISSFNGFALYKRDKFVNCVYDGRPRLDLLPKHYLKAHKVASNSGIVYPDFGHIKALYEDCEHRPFHLQAINKNNARIMISNEILFY